MSNSLGATIEQAQTAFDNGDYRSVVESCTNIIDQYPHYSAAHRLLGLAYLEQGDSAEAETWFARLLSHDPRDASAYLGLGLIAEDRGVLEHALAYCQVAWELAPYDAQYREPINRVAEKRYGSDGRLRLTHAALAQIHANGARLRRAIKEYQSALIALPDRIDLWMGLAETLWILGENPDAAEIAREFLKDHSELVPALVILADLEHRTGDTDLALEYRERLRRLDPDSMIAAAMLARQPDADADFLLVDPEHQPVLEERADAVVSERPQFVPAPDFTFQPDQESDEITDIDDLQPIRLEEFSDEMPEIPVEPTTSSFVPETIEAEEEPDTVEVEPVSPAAAEETMDDIAEHFADESMSEEPIDEEPFSFDDGDEEVSVPSLNLLDMELGDDPTPPFSDEPVDDAELGDLLGDFEGIEPMSLDDFGASDGEPVQKSSGFFEDSDIDFDIKIEDPDAVQIGGGPPKVAPGFFSGGGSLGNASGDDDDFPELPDVEEPDAEMDVDEVDRGTMILGESEEQEPTAAKSEPADSSIEPEPAAAPPAVQSGTGFTRLLGELGNEGLAPFDPTRTATGAGQPSSEESSDESPAFPSLAEGWDEIDAQLASATPGGDSGNDQLLDIDDFGLEPFALDDEDMDFVTSVEPAAPARPTAQPETPAGEAPQPEPQPTENVSDTLGGLEDVPGLEPFALEDFEDVEGSDSFEFGVLPWEQQDESAGLNVQELLNEVSEAAPDEEPLLDPELPDGVDHHLDITQELTSGSLDPQFEQRMAEVEQAARENLDRLNRDQGRAPVEMVQASDVGATIEETVEPHANVVTPTADQLVVDGDLFERTRQAKAALVDQGTIKGDRMLPALEADEPAGIEDLPVEMSEPEAPLTETESEAVEEFDQVDLEERAADSGELDALQARVEADPRDDEARWEYAEALLDQGEIHAAFTEYRWLIRHAPGRHNAIITSLEQCAYNDLEADLAHRLLADIYRRRGDGAQARNHASMAMATRRLMREIKM
ncbi:MAG: tetratricopeptide repeat protein [Thermomicrobiales bacterium]